MNINYQKRKLSDLYFGVNSNDTIKKDKKEKKKAKDQDSDDEDDDKTKLSLDSLLSSKKSDSKIERDNNHIYFYSEVDRDSIYELCVLIREAEEESVMTSFKLNIEEVPIYLHIASYGGSVHAAFSAIDQIKACRVPIYTIIDSASASAGTLISIVGKKRFIRPNAYMLIHQLSSGCWGKFAEIEDEFKNLKDMMNKIKEIYKEHATIPKKDLNELLKHDLWLDADKCISYGLVDEIWNK
jgi:ATP-dependent Clp endopeptidase proteolytic subunit ClpP